MKEVIKCIYQFALEQKLYMCTPIGNNSSLCNLFALEQKLYMCTPFGFIQVIWRLFALEQKLYMCTPYLIYTSDTQYLASISRQ